MKLAEKCQFDHLSGNDWTIATERHHIKTLRGIIADQDRGPVHDLLVMDLEAREDALAQFLNGSEYGPEKGVIAAA